MKHPDHWQRLVALAHQTPESGDGEIPHGFATRVAARAMAARKEPADLLGLFAMRALGVALAILVTSAAVSLPLTRSADNSNVIDDPVADLVAQL